MRPMRVLVACESSGRVRDAFIRAGHMAMSCDLLESESPGPHYRGDVRDVLGDAWDLMIAHPTCTRLTNSGVRWLKEPPKKLAPWQYPVATVDAYANMTRAERIDFMWEELRKGAEFYNLFRSAKIPRKAIENPVMHCHARALINPGPRQVVQPWWFGDEAFKATGLELTNLPPPCPYKQANSAESGHAGTQGMVESSFGIARTGPLEGSEPDVSWHRGSNGRPVGSARPICRSSPASAVEFA